MNTRRVTVGVVVQYIVLTLVFILLAGPLVWELSLAIKRLPSFRRKEQPPQGFFGKGRSAWCAGQNERGKDGAQAWERLHLPSPVGCTSVTSRKVIQSIPQSACSCAMGLPSPAP